MSMVLILRLRQQTAGQGRERICHAESNRRREDRVDRAGFDHIRVIAGRADGEAELCPQEQRQEHNHQRDRDQADGELLLPGEERPLEGGLHLGEDRLGLIHI